MNGMTPAEHAARAAELLELATSSAGGNSSLFPVGDEARADMVARAQVHAMLALRPEPFVAVPIVTDLPTGHAAVVRATITGDTASAMPTERLVLCRVGDDATYPWFAMRPGMVWFGDADLTDVEVLFPGAPS